jgi:hypothetical protein
MPAGIVRKEEKNMKNRKQNAFAVPGFFLLTALTVTLAGFVACSTSPNKYAGVVYNGEKTPMIADTRWDYTDSEGGKASASFEYGGKFLFRWDNGSSSEGTWERKDNNTVNCIVGGGWGRWSGNYSPETQKITGTYSGSGGITFAFTMTLLSE